MSRRALKLAVRNEIRTTLSYAVKDCDTGMDGRPPPSCGQVFVSVHSGRRTSSSRECLEEEYSISVTVTMRVGPGWDRFTQEMIDKATTGLEQRADNIRVCVHRDCMDNRIRVAANALITGDSNEFAEPLMFEDDEPPREVGPDWFHAEGVGTAGLVMQLNFGKAKRIQNLDDMT